MSQVPKRSLNYFSAMAVELHNLMVIKLVWIQRGGIAPVHVNTTVSYLIIEFFKRINQILRIKSFYGHSKKTVKTQNSGLLYPFLFCGDCQNTTASGLQL